MGGCLASPHAASPSCVTRRRRLRPCAASTSNLASTPEGGLRLRYFLDGDVNGIVLPATVAPRQADGLWQHTCFEAFIGGQGSRAYCEFNFSPSTEWAAYGFSALPRGHGADRVHDCRLRSRSASPRTASRSRRSIPLEALLALPGDGTLLLGLAAVIERPGRRTCPSGRSRTVPRSPTSTVPPASCWRSSGPARGEVRHRPAACGAGTAPAAGGSPGRAARASGVGHRRPRALARRARRVLGDLRLTAAFGPQHGLRGDKQDNMVESPDFNDPVHGIPVFSLYGEVRRPTDAMMDSFDVLLVDLQDLGCRIYTFITTLRYVLEAAARHGKAVWVLDRPNPIGRPVEGLEPARRLGELRRRRRNADAPRTHARRAGPLVRARARARPRLPRRRDGGLAAATVRPASAGRSASARGSTRARTRRTCGWRAATPAP